MCPSGSGPAQYYQHDNRSQERALDRVGCVPCTDTDFSVVRPALVHTLQAHGAWLGRANAQYDDFSDGISIICAGWRLQTLPRTERRGFATEAVLPVLAGPGAGREPDRMQRLCWIDV